MVKSQAYPSSVRSGHPLSGSESEVLAFLGYFLYIEPAVSKIDPNFYIADAKNISKLEITHSCTERAFGSSVDMVLRKLRTTNTVALWAPRSILESAAHGLGEIHRNCTSEVQVALTSVRDRFKELYPINFTEEDEKDEKEIESNPKSIMPPTFASISASMNDVSSDSDFSDSDLETRDLEKR